ncbi:Domain of uncharacterised function (DUF697) [Acholeplasma hippikon]|uniref:Domain of uncharacterized function (DUF697) n=2 Tax=Acholeplasma hippikon TaxID=264636 RepID=A0A449BJR6_9MOLU|nr:Domain of uncharacterised function (DUF697) [Acholeplasma hippikon]
MMITASVLQIGEQLKSIHPYVPYAFYGIAVLLTYFLIVKPVLIILFSPTFSIETTLDNEPEKEYKVLKRVAKRLMDRKDLPEVFQDNLEKAYHDPKLLRDALNTVYNKHIKRQINKTIRNHAKTVMVSTAISQNGRLDFITVIVVNIRMIKDLVVLCGFRPSYKNLAKLVINVFTTALIAEGLENINISDILPQSTMNMLGEIPLIKPIMSSVLDGVSNALLTLRIGIVTRKYLFDDSGEATKEKIRFGALVEAAKHLPLVIADGLYIFPKTVMNLFGKQKKTVDPEWE